MSRRIGMPVKVTLDDSGRPRGFTWRGITRKVEVIGSWRLRDRWWDHERHSDRIYYRLLTPDQQIFEIYQERTSKGLWVLDRVQD